MGLNKHYKITDENRDQYRFNVLSHEMIAADTA